MQPSRMTTRIFFFGILKVIEHRATILCLRSAEPLLCPTYFSYKLLILNNLLPSTYLVFLTFHCLESMKRWRFLVHKSHCVSVERWIIVSLNYVWVFLLARDLSLLFSMIINLEIESDDSLKVLRSEFY